MGGVVDTIFGGGPDIPGIGPARTVDMLEWGGNIDPSAIPDSFGGEALAGEYISAAEAQNLGIDRAIDQQGLGWQGAQDQFASTQASMQPYMQAGGQAFDMQAAMSGAMGPEAQAQAYQNIQVSPGQQFIRDRAQKSLMQNQAITGNLGGGRTQIGLQEQAMGFAMQDADNMFNRLGTISAPGQQYISQLGSLGGQLSGLGQGYNSNVSNMMMQQGVNTGAGGVNAAGAMINEYGQQYNAGLNQFGQLTQQQGAQNQFNMGQQQVDFQNIANEIGVDQFNTGIAQQNAANDAAGIGNLLQLGGAAAGFAFGSPELGASMFTGQNLMGNTQSRPDNRTASDFWD